MRANPATGALWYRWPPRNRHRLPVFVSNDAAKLGASFAATDKGNQENLNFAPLKSFFDDHLEDDFARVKVSRFETNERRHGRQNTVAICRWMCLSRCRAGRIGPA